MLSLRSSLLSAVAALAVFASTYQPAAAATASTYTVQGNVYRVVEFAGADSNEIRLSTVVKGPAANHSYAARVVPIKQSRFASWFKPNLGSLVKTNLWWMGFVATIESAGWAIDELRGQVVSTSSNFSRGLCHPSMMAMTTDACWQEMTVSKGLDIYEPVTPTSGWVPSSFMDGKTYYQRSFSWVKDAYGNKGYGAVYMYIQSDSFVESQSPVSDADLQAAINSQLAADPAHAATAFTDPATGRGYDDLFDPVPYIPGLSAADEALVNCYISGQLQMVNSEAACYVATQAEYDRVKAQAEALAAGRTPEAEAGALNNELKQPITQAQYEESNKKYSDAVADVTADVNAKNDSDYSDLDDKFNELDGIITDLPNTSLPAPADISVPQYVDCQQLHLSDGNGHELDFPNASQCAKIETFKQGFGYFLAISVVFLLGMQLLTRPHG